MSIFVFNEVFTCAWADVGRFVVENDFSSIIFSILWHSIKQKKRKEKRWGTV